MPEQTHWVIRTQTNRERWAAENAARLGYEYYFPQVMETVRHVTHGIRRREFRTRPLFPSYLFVLAVENGWYQLLNCFGVAGIIPGSSGAPGTIRDSALNELRALEVNGLVQLPKPDAKEFPVNSPVRITSGTYTGFTGLVDGTAANERIKVLLDYMGRKVPFLVRKVDLEAAA